MNYECYQYKFVIHMGSFFILIDWSQKYELCVVVILPKAIFFREVGGAYEYLCRMHAVHDVITSTFSLLRRS